jgi:hypothetical protein
MAIRKSSNSGIPFGNTASRPASASIGQPYFNGEVGRLELYSSNGWQNIVQETPGVASASGTYNESAGSGTFTVSGTNFVDGAIAYAVGTNGTEYQATTTTYNSLVQVTAVFSNLSPAYEPYDIKITNPSNLFGLLPDAFYINDSPIWSTASGSLGSYASSVSIQLSATDDESNTITYSVTSGSLPSGLSLSSGGLISGTVTATPATYTFTVSASDGVNTAQTRSFSITAPAIITGGELTSDSTYYYRTFTGSGSLTTNLSLLVDYLLVAGGGGGGAYHSGGGGAGGYLSSSTTISPNTYSIEVGGGGAIGDAGSYEGTKGTDSSFNSLTSFGGGRGIRQGSTTDSNHDGGSGGGAADNVSRAATGVVGQGYNGGYDSGGGNTYAYSYATGGGGGAGGPGISPNTVTTSGGGGPGLQWVNGSYYAGGGGGGNLSESAILTAGIGGIGGGGTSGLKAGGGTLHRGLENAQGVENTGGGGAGNLYSLGGGSGGSGIVIIRYTKASVGD